MSNADPELSEGVGQRTRTLRKLHGMTQAQLAAAACVSVSLIGAVEQGKSPASAAFVAAVARAFRVSVPDFYGQPVARFGAERAGVADLETAVMAGPALAADGPTPTVAELEARLRECMVARKQSRYDWLATELPLILAAAQIVVASESEPERAWRVLAQAHLHSLIVLYRLGSDVASLAADAGVRAAQHAGDAVLASVLTVEGCLPLLQRGAYSVVDTITERARALLDDVPTDDATRSAEGFAHLRSAIVSARAGDEATSADHLDQARRLAAEVPSRANVYGTSFNADNVIMHGVAAAVESADGAEALRRRAPLGDGVTPSRRAHHHIDLSRAHLLVGDRDNTLAELNAARRAAPQLTRYHPQVHETVRVLAETDRRRTDSLAGFALWAGVAV